MAEEDPYAGDNIRAEAWELSGLAGFNEPETDHFLPYSPELLDIYTECEQIGRDERRQLPPESGGVDTDHAELLKLAGTLDFTSWPVPS